MAAAIAGLLHLNDAHAAESPPLPLVAANDHAPPTPSAPAGPTGDDGVSALMDNGDWPAALLEPLDAGLRAELLVYGDLAQATYDAFDRRTWSPHCGTCVHGLRRLLPALGLAGHGYAATAFVYATCDVAVPRWLERPLRQDSAWDGHANWMGYVAVARRAGAAGGAGVRDIVVVWRGTVAPDEWLQDMRTRAVPFELDAATDRGATVAEGFHAIYTSRRDAAGRFGARSAREQVSAELARLVSHFRGRGEAVRVTATGHSLGGALALLAARDAAAAHPGLPVRAVTFGAPRVGNGAFRDGLAARGVRVLRVVVRRDVVPTVPAVPGAVVDAPLSRPLAGLWALLRRPPPAWAYVHAGDELQLDVSDSPYLKRRYSVLGFHNLETCLHLLDSRETAGGGFRAGATRDYALVNKTSGMLRDELRIPEWWYEPANKGLVRNAAGRWVVGERAAEDLPVPDDLLPLSELD